MVKRLAWLAPQRRSPAGRHTFHPGRDAGAQFLVTPVIDRVVCALPFQREAIEEPPRRTWKAEAKLNEKHLDQDKEGQD
jgi:hypothetical protein